MEKKKISKIPNIEDLALKLRIDNNLFMQEIENHYSEKQQDQIRLMRLAKSLNYEELARQIIKKKVGKN